MALADEYLALQSSWTRTLRRKAEKTVIVYNQGARSLLDYLLTEDGPDVPEPVDRPATVADLASRHIDGWINDQQRRGYKSAGINNRYRAIQQFLNWLVDEGEVETHPMARMKAPKVEVARVETVTPEHLKALLATCKGRTFVATRDAALILLYVDSGGRLSEIAGLTLDDLDLKADAAYSIGKGGKPRVHSFGNTTAGAVERYLRQRARHKQSARRELWLGVKRDSPLTTDGVDQMLRRRCDLARIPRINAHKFRHTMATEFLDSGGSEGDLMRLMGWDSRQMIKRYTDTTAERRAVAAHKSRSLADRLL